MKNAILGIRIAVVAVAVLMIVYGLGIFIGKVPAEQHITGVVYILAAAAFLKIFLRKAIKKIVP